MYPHKRHVAAVGFDRDDMTLSAITYDEMRPGCYEPKARVDDMDLNHVEASLCFPTFPPFCSQTFASGARPKGSRSPASTPTTTGCTRSGAVMAAGAASCRCIIPLLGCGLAAAECAAMPRGVRAVCFSEIPPNLGLPSIHTGYWDPFFAACEQAEPSVMHAHRVVVEDAGDFAGAPPAVQATLSFGQRCRRSPTSSSPVCSCGSRTLKLAYSEGQIGWIPYVLERVDDVWREHRVGRALTIVRAPSTYSPAGPCGCFFA